MIQIDIVPENIGRQYPVSVGILGDAKLALTQLVSQLGDYSGDKEFLSDMLDRKMEWKKHLEESAIADSEATPVPPIALQKELQKHLLEGSVFCVDAGNPGAWTHYTTFPKNMAYFKPVNYGNMGFSLGAALGCKEAEPEREVIALLGDGSLGMTLGDLETIGREALPIIIILVNDSAYGNIKQEELYKMGENRYIGVEFKDYDYINVAKTFGVDGCIVTKASQIGDALQTARNSGKPFMIEVKLDGSYTVWPEAI